MSPARREEAEANGTREVSAFGSVCYTLNGADAESANMHITIAVLFANGDSTGFPDRGGQLHPGRFLGHGGRHFVGAHHDSGSRRARRREGGSRGSAGRSTARRRRGAI